MVSLYFSLSLRRLSRYWAHTRNQVLLGIFRKECLLYPEKVQCRRLYSFLSGKAWFDILSFGICRPRILSAVMLPIISKIFFTKISWSNFFEFGHLHLNIRCFHELFIRVVICLWNHFQSFRLWIGILSCAGVHTLFKDT